MPRGDQRVEHIVRRGDSLWSIGRKYGVSTRKLASWNGMAPGDTLSAGRKLVIWTSGDATPVAAVSPGAPNLTRKLRYTVRKGDSLSAIAARFRVRVSDLTRWNDISASRILRPGQKLTMYVDVTRQSS